MLNDIEFIGSVKSVLERLECNAEWAAISL
ncbi:hypothetical protein [Anaerocolumna sp. MB42-C2]